MVPWHEEDAENARIACINMAVSINWWVHFVGVLIKQEPYHFGWSILDAPDIWKLPYR